MRTLFILLLLVGMVAALGKAVSAPRDTDDVLTYHYSGNKFVSISVPVIGDEPVVDYYLYPTGDDTVMTERDHIRGWVVDVKWEAGKSEPSVDVFYDDCGWGCNPDGKRKK